MEYIKPKLELMSYLKRNGPSKEARLKNKLRFMIKAKPYKFLKKLMKFTTDEYTPFVRNRRYLNRQISYTNLEVFKKNLFIDSVYASKTDRDSYYEAMALANSRLTPTYKETFIFRKFYFNQRSLSILKHPHFKRNQVNLIRSLSVSESKKKFHRGVLSKEAKKTIFACVSLKHPKLTSKGMRLILGKTKKLKKIKKALNNTRVNTKKNTCLSDNKFIRIGALKKKDSNDAKLLNKIRKLRLFSKKKNFHIPKNKLNKARLLTKLSKKIKEEKSKILGSLIKSKPVMVFKKNINASSLAKYLAKYRYLTFKAISYLSKKPANKLKYVGFKKLKGPLNRV